MALTELNKEPFVGLSSSANPCILLRGGWGTGKTETLLQTIMCLLNSRNLPGTSTTTVMPPHTPNALPPHTPNEMPHPERMHILLATHTNSAADYCITKRLHEYMCLHRECTMLRVVKPGRWVRSIDPLVLPYCTRDKQGNMCVWPPSQQLHEAHLLVMTLSLALSLARNTQLTQFAGHFTHIFMDEAGQCLEVEALIPLLLASPNTVVFLAGYSNWRHTDDFTYLI